MKKPNIRRLALAVQASAGGPVFVHSLSDRSKLQAVTAGVLSQTKTVYDCPDCKTSIVASANKIAPHCIVCSAETKPTSKTAKVTASKDLSGLTAVECGHCGTVSVMQSNVVTASMHHLHCPACGGSNDFKSSVKASADGTEMDKPPVDPIVDQDKDTIKSDADEMPGNKVDNDWPYNDDQKAKKADGEKTEPKEPKAEPKAEAKEPKHEEPDGDEIDDLDDDVEIKDESDSPPEFDADEIDMKSAPMGEEPIELEDLDDFDPDIDEKASAEEEPIEDIQSQSTLQPMSTPNGNSPMNLDCEPQNLEATGGEEELKMLEPEHGDTMADAFEVDDTAAGLSFETKAGRLVAFKAHLAIASLTPEAAGRNADLLNTRGFHQALASMARESGLRKTLVSAGFKMVRLPVLTKATVERRVREAVAASAASKQKDLGVLVESMALAAAGLARGQWRGKENPLLAAFATELKTLGVRNPERVASRVLSENVVPFTRSLVEIASDLSKMSVQSRKETAALLEMTTPLQIQSSVADNDEEDDEDGDLEARLNATAAVVRASIPSKHSTRLTASNSTSAEETARRILSGELPLSMN